MRSPTREATTPRQAPPQDAEALIAQVRENLIGDDALIDGPFGPVRLVYADYTASGRALEYIEAGLRKMVLPLYANTHTESSGTGAQTTQLREEAREMVRSAVGGTADDAVIFCGSGSTAAINHLIDILNLRIPAALEQRYGFRAQIPEAERPVVFVGPYEHHSNELPWRESIADVVEIEEDADGHVDLAQLERALVEHADRRLKIGSFSAASNVTGILTDVRALSRLLHSHGALTFVDYAAAAPYVPIHMAGESPGDGPATPPLDAIFLSPHKLVGGPGAPGVLVVKRHLLTNRVPGRPGGGTVAYVNGRSHSYITHPEHREEGGTPDILGSIRAGLAFALKQAVGTKAILAREHDFTQRALGAWQAHPNLDVLGNLAAERLSILSFRIRCGQGHLHHEFVVALLNDLFGIQARSGCSCAGPYGHRLLGIDSARSTQFERAILEGWEGLKPGWARLGFNYFFTDTVVDYITEAVGWIADHGWKLLPAYRFQPATGRWTHRYAPWRPRLSLKHLTLAGSALASGAPPRSAPETQLAEQIRLAKRTVEALTAHFALSAPEPAQDENELPAEFAGLRWFPLPQEAVAALEAACDTLEFQMPVESPAQD